MVPKDAASVNGMKRILVFSIFAFSLALPTSAQAAAYKNCAALRKIFPSGVAKSAIAAAKQSGSPKVSAKIYKQNKKMDRDNDGVACEK